MWHMSSLKIDSEFSSVFVGAVLEEEEQERLLAPPGLFVYS